MPVKRESWETPKEFHSRLLETGVFSSEAKQLLLELDTVVKEAAFGHDPATWETKGLLVVGQLQSHLRTSAPSASPRE